MNLLEVKPRDYHRLLVCNRSNILLPDSWLSKSVLWELDDSSLWKWRYQPKEYKYTGAMEWGSLIDCLTTTPELVGEDVVISPYDTWRTDESKIWRKKQHDEKKIIVSSEDMKEAQKAKKMLLETCKATADIYAKSKGQVIIGGNILGANVKGLLDLVPEGEDFLPDLKTTARFSLEGFAKQTASLGYFMQMGLYRELWNVSHPQDQRERVKLIWQDANPPYEACVMEMSPADLDAGYEYACALIRRLLDATADDCWPMAFEKEQIISRPTWAAMQLEERMSTPTTEQP